MIIAIGASRVGCGISSVKWVMASKPIRDRADCKSPRIHATPSGQPVSFVKTVKTKSASVLGAVARITADVAIHAVIDQKTAYLSDGMTEFVAVLVVGLTCAFVPFS